MFRNYFKIALRFIARNRIYSFINMAGLSLGLACAMLIILYTKDEVSYDRFQKQSENIYRITSERVKPDGSVDFKGGYSGYFQGPRFTAGIPEIKSFVRYQSNTLDVKQGTEIKPQEIFWTDTSFFSVFSFSLLSGNPSTVLQNPNSVVISEDLARKFFGKENPIGKVMEFRTSENFEPYTVTGVAKKCPQNSSIKFDALLPIKVSKEDEARNDNWFNFFLNTFVVLNNGAKPEQVVAKMKTVYENDAKEAIKKMAEQFDDKSTTVYGLQPLLTMHLSEDYKPENGLVDASNPTYSYILSGIALFILLIACINFINLTIARSLKRAKEIGIRKVVGSDRRQLILQFLGESFVICGLAFLFAVLLVQFFLPVFNRLTNKELALSYLFDWKLILGYLSLLIFTSLLAGFYPALVLSKFNPVQTLYNRFRFAGKNYLQKILVVFQFTLASILIIGTVTIYSQFNYLTHTDLGYNDKEVINVNKNRMSRNEAEVFRQELMKDPNILEVAFKNGGRWGTIAKINGETQIPFDYETVDEEYLPLFKIGLTKGRNFSKDYPSDSTHSILVNEAFVKKAGWKDPIGQQVNFWYNEGEIYNVVGVVKDYHFRPLSEEIPPQLFTMKPGNMYGAAFIKVKPGSEAKILRYIETTFKKLFPLNPYSYEFKDQQNIKQYEAEAKWKQVILFGAILTIFVSCIGLFGLSVLAAQKRTKEIGIRKVLGASAGRVVTILSTDFMKLVLISLAIALPIGWLGAKKWLQSYPYRIDIGFWIFGLTALMVILVALFTISFQSIRAAVSNPVKSLRTE